MTRAWEEGMLVLCLLFADYLTLVFLIRIREVRIPN